MQTYKNLLASLVGLTALACVSTIASASPVVLYTNGAVQPGSSSAYADLATAGNAQGSMYGSVFTVPTISGFPTTAPVSSIDFGGLFSTTPNNAPTANESFTINFYLLDSNGKPDPTQAILSTTLTNVTYTDIPGGSHFNSNVDFNTISGQFAQTLTLVVGTQYYLGITDTNTGAGFGTAETLDPDASIDSYQQQGGTFVSTREFDAPMAFTLSVPEPGESTLLILGGIGLLVAGKFRARFFCI